MASTNGISSHNFLYAVHYHQFYKPKTHTPKQSPNVHNHPNGNSEGTYETKYTKPNKL